MAVGRSAIVNGRTVIWGHPSIVEVFVNLWNLSTTGWPTLGYFSCRNSMMARTNRLDVLADGIIEDIKGRHQGQTSLFDSSFEKRTCGRPRERMVDSRLRRRAIDSTRVSSPSDLPR